MIASDAHAQPRLFASTTSTSLHTATSYTTSPSESPFLEHLGKSAFKTIDMVNIYLNIEDRQVLALSIPFSDIERLSIRPLKWLRFVAFAVCGAHGHLSATPNGPPVNYDSVTLAGPIAESYYYTFHGKLTFSQTCRSWLMFLLLCQGIITSSTTMRWMTELHPRWKPNAPPFSAVGWWSAMAQCVSSQATRPTCAMLPISFQKTRAMRYLPSLLHFTVLLNPFLVHRCSVPRSSWFVRLRAGTWYSRHQLCWERNIFEKGYACIVCPWVHRFP